MTPPIPPSSNPVAAVRTSHARTKSGTPSPRLELKATKRVGAPEPEIHFTTFIRLPFNRGDFVDPPQVDWDANKDRALWKILSKTTRSTEQNWEEISAKFGVSLPFILQQSAWLYERHLSQMRAQIRKVGTSAVTAASSAPPASSGSVTATQGGYPMRRLGSGGGSRAPSSLSMRQRESPALKADTSAPGTPRAGAPSLSRTPSTTTVTQSRMLPSSPRQPSNRSFRSSLPPGRKADASGILPPRPDEASRQPASPTSPSPPDAGSSESDSSSDDEPLNVQSQLLKRPPRFNNRKISPLGRLDDEEEQDDEEEDLPFASRPENPTTDPLGTTRSQAPSHQHSHSHTHRANPSTSTTDQNSPSDLSSSTSSLAHIPAAGPSNPQALQKSPPPFRGPLSPHHRAELSRLSPRHRVRREGSDGTPSMGSSFSDLDADSLTNSALEEALLSNMQKGPGAGQGSRMSRWVGSRYL